MNTTLSVKLDSQFNHALEPIEFFTAENLDEMSESLLMHRVKELLSILKNMGRSVHLQLNAEVPDAVNTAFIINKRKGRSVESRQKLSARENEVFELIVQGYTNSQIAGKLFISFETVRTHRKNIIMKTAVKNTAALIGNYYQSFAAGN